MTVTVQDLAAGMKALAGRSGMARTVSTAQMFEPDLSGPDLGRGGSAVVHLTPRQAAYLRSLPKAGKFRIIRAVFKQKPACIVLTGGLPCPELEELADRSGIPVLKTGDRAKLVRRLNDLFVQRTSLHGVLVQIFGLGTLIIGESAIGKSEAALDLVLRGHKLVADDLVVVEKKDRRITGKPTDMSADLLEIRGLGIINIRSLYGDSAIVPSSAVGLIVELEEWKQGRQYSLLGFRERRYKLLGVGVPYLKLPVKLGRNMATIIEVAARNQTLKNRGIYTARDLNRRLKKKLSGEQPS